MKLLATTSTILLGLFAWHHFEGPWYGAMLIPMLASLMFFPKWKWAFAASFVASSLVWGYAILPAKDAVLTQNMAELFQLPNAEVLVFGTLALAGIFGGVGATFGWAIRNTFAKKRRMFKSY